MLKFCDVEISFTDEKGEKFIDHWDKEKVAAVQQELKEIMNQKK